MPSNLDDLLPHRAPMQWIDELAEFTETSAVGMVVFNEGHFAVVDDTVAECALVECMAQTVAAAQGSRAKARGDSGGAKGGMLTSVSDFRIVRSARAGEKLRIEVRELKRLGPMLLVAGEISCDGQSIATGELTLYA